jgi:hypothetical protein
LNDVAIVNGIEFVEGIPRESENYLTGDFYQNNVLLDICTRKLDRWKIVHAITDHINLALSAKNDGPKKPTLCTSTCARVISLKRPHLTVTMASRL